MQARRSLTAISHHVHTTAIAPLVVGHDALDAVDPFNVAVEPLAHRREQRGDLRAFRHRLRVRIHLAGGLNGAAEIAGLLDLLAHAGDDAPGEGVEAFLRRTGQRERRENALLDFPL